MPSVTLPLPVNALYKEPQQLEFEKIATFIGGNGSGKSTILKSIFDEKLKGTAYDDYKIVCFSSGQNESFSKGFGKYLNAERAKKNALNLDCFYYDKSWASLLIFLATTSKSDGLVRSFLREKEYVSEDDGQDETTTLTLNVKVDKAYINLVKQARDDEAKGETDVITNKAYYQTLYSFVNYLIVGNYDFEESLEQREVQLTQDKLSKVSFETDDLAPFDSKVVFFTQAADNDYFIIKDSFNLKFVQKVNNSNWELLDLEDLSDGEYQLLFIFALIDLFDSDKTLFLLDEADSHLHYKNIDRLWVIFNSIQGRVITTTHLLDSITKSGIDKLRVIEKGKVELGNKLLYLTNRLKELSEINNTHLQALSMFENVVYIDDENDWEIFKLLVIRKLADTTQKALDIEKKFTAFIAVKQTSDYGDATKKFAESKLKRLENFTSYLEGHSHIIKNVYLLCDRDEFLLDSIGTNKCQLLVQGDSIKKFNGGKLTSHLLSWKRREIKHYLLSATALGEENIDSINDRLDLGPQSKLCVGSSGDYKTDKKYNRQLAYLDSSLVKDILHTYINIENQGFCIEKTKGYIKRMPKEEISEDIENLYNYLVTNNE